MTIAECEARNKAIIDNLKLWANGKDCDIIEQFAIAIAGEVYDISIPKAFYHFISSDNPNSCCATGAHKTIFRTLDKIKKVIVE